MNTASREFLTDILQKFGWAWWVEIQTSSPECTYYFGPFMTESEAKRYTDGYREDLEKEGAEGIKIRIRRCNPPPDRLTIEGKPNGIAPVLMVSLVSSIASLSLFNL
jgi:hypothetical protein